MWSSVKMPPSSIGVSKNGLKCKIHTYWGMKKHLHIFYKTDQSPKISPSKVKHISSKDFGKILTKKIMIKRSTSFSKIIINYLLII